jgi:hypothetical protein
VTNTYTALDERDSEPFPIISLPNNLQYVILHVDHIQGLSEYLMRTALNLKEIEVFKKYDIKSIT